MFCPSCGAKLNEGAFFCAACGMAVASLREKDKQCTIPLIGFSSKIRDPAFVAYRKKSVGWAFIFAGMLAIIAIIGFPVYGNVSREIEWPNSLFYGIGIGGMFIVIALMQTIKSTMDRTWDGEVVFKDSYTSKERDNDGQIHYYRVYVLKIRKNSGKIKKHKWRDIPGVFNYYNIGDRVRHHKGFLYYEKHDKSKDTQIMCTACLAFSDIDKDICPRCKCPLLK